MTLPDLSGSVMSCVAISGDLGYTQEAGTITWPTFQPFAVMELVDLGADSATQQTSVPYHLVVVVHHFLLFANCHLIKAEDSKY